MYCCEATGHLMVPSASDSRSTRARPPHPIRTGSGAGMPKRRGLLARFVNERQAARRYVFTTADVAALGLSQSASYAALGRLVDTGRIAKVGGRRGVWMVVPHEYQNVGAPPAAWILDDVMTALGTAYYVGLRSAAEWYGATHHAVQVVQVVVPGRVHSFTVGRERVRFIQKHSAGSTPVRRLPGPVTMLRVSTPEATALDLVRFMDDAGGLNAVAGVLRQMVAGCTADGMREALNAAQDVPSAQRLGCLLEVVDRSALAPTVAAWLRPHRPRVVPLELGPQSGGASSSAHVDPTWRVTIARAVDASL